MNPRRRKKTVAEGPQGSGPLPEGPGSSTQPRTQSGTPSKTRNELKGDVTLKKDALEQACTHAAGRTPAGDAPTEDLDEKAQQLVEAQRAANLRYLRNLGRVGNTVVLLVGVGVPSYVARTHATWAETTAADRSAAFSTGIAAVVILLLSLLKRNDGGLKSYLIGADGRFSTSRTQVALWTLALAYTLLFLTLQAPLSPKNSAASNFAERFKELDITYLLLLGGPFAAAGAARAIVGRKVSENTIQKLDAAETKVRDVVSNDSGVGDLIDLQFFVFNIVALVYFVAVFSNEPTALPQLPGGLAGLTSVAALAYAGSKALEENRPLISTITRRTGSGPIHPNTTVDIRGANFVPLGATDLAQLTQVHVKFGERDVPVVPEKRSGRYWNPSSDKITVTVPSDVASGTVEVVVITAAGVESHPYPLQVEAPEPVVMGIEPTPPVQPAATLTLRGRNFKLDGAGEATVFLGVIPVLASRTEDTNLELEVPSVLSGETVEISVQAAGSLLKSPAVTVPVRSGPSIRSAVVADDGSLVVTGNFGPTGWTSAHTLLVNGEPVEARSEQPGILRAALQRAPTVGDAVDIVVVDETDRASEKVSTTARSS